MDVTPQALREVEFREKMRGYHPEDVDAFLERVADGLEVLQDRLRQAMDRATRAEQQAAEAGGTDETLRKTLLLAQRTADLAVQEARDQAARILAGAEQQAQSILGDAEEKARLASEEAQAGLRADVSRLEGARAQLQQEVDGLRRWVEEQKGRLSSTLSDAMGRINQLGVSSDPPAVSQVDVPPRRTPTDAGGPARPAQAPAAERSPSAGTNTGPAQAAATAGAAAEHRPSPDGRAPQPIVAAEGPPTAAWRPEPDINLADDQPARAERPIERPAAPAALGGDPYFAELRRAVDEAQPLGPRDAPFEGPAQSPAPPAGSFYDQSEDDDHLLGGRLRRRR
jgi:cell division initiation protein